MGCTVSTGRAGMDDRSVESGAAALEWMGSVSGALGVIGLLLYVGSYFALQLGLIRGDGWLFPALNLAAALSLILSLIEAFNPFAMAVQVAWTVISIIGLVRLYLVYRYLRFTDEERGAVARLVPGLSKDRARRLLAQGVWTDAAPGRVLAREGEPVGYLYYQAEGVCRIEIDGTAVASIGAGGLVGEMTFHTGAPATATVTVAAPARLLVFERRAFQSFLGRNEDIRAAIEQSVAGDLRRKLAATSRTLAHGVPGAG
jgi:CRP-like cAMP-binding protein